MAYMKILSTVPLIRRVIQIKPAMRFYFTYIRMTILKKERKIETEKRKSQVLIEDADANIPIDLLSGRMRKILDLFTSKREKQRERQKER